MATQTTQKKPHATVTPLENNTPRKAVVMSEGKFYHIVKVTARGGAERFALGQHRTGPRAGGYNWIIPACSSEELWDKLNERFDFS
jgi:hypothetical protein